MLRRWRLLGPVLLSAAFLSTLALHAYLGIFSRFIADDYCSAGMARRFGVLRAVWYWYLNWTGRYSASALDAVFGLLGPAATPFVTAVVLLVWLGILAWTAALFFSGSTRLRLSQCLAIALAILFLTLSLSPNVPQSLYWGQGMRSIVPPLILSALFADLLLLFNRRKWLASQSALWLALGFLVSLLMGGLNETFTALELSSLIFAVSLALVLGKAKSHRSVVTFLAAGVLGAGLAFLIVVIAPGNAFRQAFYPPPPEPLAILRISLAGFWQFLAASFDRLDRLTAAIGAITLSIFLGMQVQPPQTRLRAVPFVISVGLALAFICFLPAAYGLSDVPPDRTLMIPAYLIGVALVLSGFILGSSLNSRRAGHRWRTSLEAGVLAFSAVACFTSVFLADRLLLASRQAYVDYALNWERMNSLIVDAHSQGQTQVVIQTMPNWADLDEPNDNPKFWVNVCYREYYGIEVLAESQP